MGEPGYVRKRIRTESDRKCHDLFFCMCSFHRNELLKLEVVCSGLFDIKSLESSSHWRMSFTEIIERCRTNIFSGKSTFKCIPGEFGKRHGGLEEEMN